MKQVLISEELLRQVLTQLELGGPEWERDNMITALRAALNKEPAPVQEPVGGLDDATRIGWAMWRIKDLEQQLASRPAYIAQQPAPPADVPLLTEDEIVVALHVALPSLSYDSEDAFINGVRAGEQAVRQKAGLK